MAEIQVNPDDPGWGVPDDGTVYPPVDETPPNPEGG